MSTLRRWVVIVAALATTTVIWGIVLPAFNLWAPQWITAFGSGHGEVMTANTLNQIGMGVLAPIAGYAVGRFRVRTLMLLGVLLTALALFLISVASAMWQVTLIHALLLAAGIVLCGPLITQVLAVRLFQENRGLAIGVVTAGAPMCSFTLPPLIGLLLTRYDWRMVEIQMGILVLLLVPLIALAVRETPVAQNAVEEEDAMPQPTLNAGGILRNRVFWGLLFAVLPLNFLFNAIYFNLGFSLADMGNGAAYTATIITVTGLISLPGVLVFGALSDRVAHLPLLIGTVAVVALTCIVAARADNYMVLLLDLPVMGFAIGGLMPLVAAMLAKGFGTDNFARANGLITPFVTLGTLGSAGAGFARDYLGSYPAAYTMMLAALPLCLLGLWLLRRGGGTRIPAVAPA